MNEAERCDRMSMMHRGHVLACGPPAQLVADRKAPSLEAAFIGYLEEEAAKRGVVLLHKPQHLHEIARVVGQVLTAVRLGRPTLALLPELTPASPG